MAVAEIVQSNHSAHNNVCVTSHYNSDVGEQLTNAIQRRRKLAPLAVNKRLIETRREVAAAAAIIRRC